MQPARQTAKSSVHSKVLIIISELALKLFKFMKKKRIEKIQADYANGED
jgi:hypothetical protein